jgi:hypothetical protein
MYEISLDTGAEVYPDLWQKGRYRVELSVELQYGLSDVDAALQKLGYNIIDADQWGQSYQDKNNSDITAELDETEADTISLRLIMRYGDLGEQDVESARAQVESVYERIGQICQGHYSQYDYEPLEDSFV